MLAVSFVAYLRFVASPLPLAALEFPSYVAVILMTCPDGRRHFEFERVQRLHISGKLEIFHYSVTLTLLRCGVIVGAGNQGSLQELPYAKLELTRFFIYKTGTQASMVRHAQLGVQPTICTPVEIKMTVKTLRCD